MNKFFLKKIFLIIIPPLILVIFFLFFYKFHKSEDNNFTKNEVINFAVIDSDLVKSKSKIFLSVEKIKNDGIEKIKNEVNEYDKNLRLLILKSRDESLNKYERNKFKIAAEKETQKIEKIIIERRQILKDGLTIKMNEIENEFKKTIRDYAISRNISVVLNKKINKIQSVFFSEKKIEITNEIIKLFDEKIKLFF